jgi:hypothetical protein
MINPERTRADADVAAGAVAYTAYGKATGGRTHDNRLMPQWGDLAERTRAGWVAAAKAVAGAEFLTSIEISVDVLTIRRRVNYVIKEGMVMPLGDDGGYRCCPSCLAVMGDEAPAVPFHVRLPEGPLAGGDELPGRCFAVLCAWCAEQLDPDERAVYAEEYATLVWELSPAQASAIADAHRAAP